MKIKYDFATGDFSEIEIDDRWAEVLADLDRIEYNNNKKEKRRHYSIDAIVYEGSEYGTEDAKINEITEEESELDRLAQAFSHLNDSQKTLLNAIYFNGVSVNEYAAKEGVDHSAISHRIERAIKKLKKFY